MTGIIIGAVLAVIVAAVVVMLTRRTGGLSAHGRELRRLADLRGWHYSRPDSTAETYGLSGESMLRGADGSSLDWRIRWHLRSTKEQGKDKTEFKCADVPLEQGWVFIDARSHAGEIKARQRASGIANGQDDHARKATWKDALAHSHEVPVGTPDFLSHFIVCA